MEEKKGNTEGIFHLKNSLKAANDDFDLSCVQSKDKENGMNGDSDNYNDIYRELAELVGYSAVNKIWKRYAGISIDFPQRLYSRRYSRQYITENLDSMKPSEMARTLNLSERRVRQIISVIRGEGGNKK